MASNSESNGKTQWIFWLAGLLATLILGVTLPTMCNEIIKNDRLSRERDSAIEEKVNNLRVSLMVDISRQYSEIIQRLTKIETQISK